MWLELPYFFNLYPRVQFYLVTFYAHFYLVKCGYNSRFGYYSRAGTNWKITVCYRKLVVVDWNCLIKLWKVAKSILHNWRKDQCALWIIYVVLLEYVRNRELGLVHYEVKDYLCIIASLVSFRLIHFLYLPTTKKCTFLIEAKNRP